MINQQTLMIFTQLLTTARGNKDEADTPSKYFTSIVIFCGKL